MLRAIILSLLVASSPAMAQGRSEVCGFLGSIAESAVKDFAAGHSIALQRRAVNEVMKNQSANLRKVVIGVIEAVYSDPSLLDENPRDVGFMFYARCMGSTRHTTTGDR